MKTKTKIKLFVLLLTMLFSVNFVFAFCNDTDTAAFPSINYNKQGTVCTDVNCSTDWCYQNKYLNEYYCNSSADQEASYYWPYLCPGNCSNGACVNATVSTCTTGQTQTCTGSNPCKVYKKTCTNGVWGNCTSYANAAYGTLCGTHGACNPTGTCYEYTLCNDTDKTSAYANAKNIYQKGFMNMRSYPLGGTPTTYTTGIWESCASTTKVKEYYCASNGAAIWEYLTCPTGYNCSNGACIKPAPTCTATWLCNGSYSQYKNASCAITRSTYCANGCLNGACINASVCTNNSECPSKAQYYCNGSYSYAVVSSYACSGGQCISTGGGRTNDKYCPNGCLNGSCVSQNTCEYKPLSCYDEDNGNFFTKGSYSFVSIGSNCSVITQSGNDSCNNPSSTWEFSCGIDAQGNLGGLWAPFPCPSGSCINGSCTKSYCDNGEARSCSGINSCKNYSIICTNNTWDGGCVEIGNRPAGSSCYNGGFCDGKGVCIINTTEITNCTDSDGGQDFYTAGIVTLGNETQLDVCLSESHVSEFYCGNGAILGSYLNCPSGNCSNGACINATSGGLYSQGPGVFARIGSWFKNMFG